MAITTGRNGNVNGMAHATREIAEAQRSRYEALAENFEGFQRRSVDFARGGLEFLELQESSVRAAQQWWASGMRLLRLQQRNVSFVQDWMTSGLKALRNQTEHNRRTAEVIARSAHKQQEGFLKLTEEWARVSQDFFFTPVAYVEESLRVAQQATHQALQATERITDQGLRLAEEANERSERALEQVERATRQAELRATILRVFKTENYDELTVDEISRKLDGLSDEEIKQVREYEKRNKNRDTLVEEMDRKIRASS